MCENVVTKSLVRGVGGWNKAKSFARWCHHLTCTLSLLYPTHTNQNQFLFFSYLQLLEKGTISFTWTKQRGYLTFTTFTTHQFLLPNELFFSFLLNFKILFLLCPGVVFLYNPTNVKFSGPLYTHKSFHGLLSVSESLANCSVPWPIFFRFLLWFYNWFCALQKSFN